jgi:ABC-type glycerol-3-phosphate transport system substrate-binding protein
LEFVEQFPEEFDYSVYDDTEYWSNYESMYREGTALLSTVYLSDFATYNYQKKGTFGEDITFIGFPASNENGSAINYDISFAMSSKSDKKDGAWDFLRYYLTDEYQDSITYGFPISIERLNELAETAKQRPFYLDENGNKVEYDQTYYLNDVEIIIEPCTDAEIDQVMTFLKSLNQSTTYDSSLMKIVTEEAESFFSGQKSASEVAEIIQSRVQIYVSENM